MESRTITFETAKLLAYCTKDIPSEKSYVQINGEILLLPTFSTHESQVQYACPTQDLVAKWLRDTEDIIVQIKPYKTEDGINFYDYDLISEQFSSVSFDNSGEMAFLNYESAMEAALKEALYVTILNGATIYI